MTSRVTQAVFNHNQKTNLTWIHKIYPKRMAQQITNYSKLKEKYSSQTSLKDNDDCFRTEKVP